MKAARPPSRQASSGNFFGRSKKKDGRAARAMARAADRAGRPEQGRPLPGLEGLRRRQIEVRSLCSKEQGPALALLNALISVAGEYERVTGRAVGDDVLLGTLVRCLPQAIRESLEAVKTSFESELAAKELKAATAAVPAALQSRASSPWRKLPIRCF